MPQGFSVWRICVQARKGWDRDQIRARFGPIIGEMFRSSFQWTTVHFYPYGDSASAAAFGSGNARPYQLIEWAFGTAEDAAMAVPAGTLQTRCWAPSDIQFSGKVNCFRQVEGGEPCWWLLVWVYWRGEPVTGEWPLVRDDLGRIMAVADVVSVPRATAWEPADKGIVGVLREQIAKHLRQTWDDLPKKPSDLPTWVWLAGAGVLAWYTRPMLANLTRGGRR
jgi:hypothetical protein